MSEISKFMIPLICENITKEDLTKECGFVDAFTNDINRPYLDHHLFLMYERDTSTTKKHNTKKKFENTKCASRICKIDGKWVIIYIYPYIKTFEMKLLLSGTLPFKEESKIKILNFWGTTDKDVNDFLFNKKTFLRYICHTIKEEDYVYEVDYKLNKKSKVQ